MQDKKRTQKATSRKVKVVGTQEYIDAQTGELVSMQVSRVEDRDFNFTKVWMQAFVATLNLVGNKTTQTAMWVIEHLNKENQLTYTYRQIKEETGFSLETVTKTMNALIEGNFLRRKNQGCYIVNPDIIFAGSHSNRLDVLTQYIDIGDETETRKPKKPTPQEELANITKSINILTKRAEELAEQINDAQDDDQIAIDDEYDEDYNEERTDTRKLAG